MMLINGVHFAANDNNQIEILRMLPTAFAKRNARSTVLEHKDPDARNSHDVGGLAWRISKGIDRKLIAEAAAVFNSVAKKCAVVDDPSAQALNLHSVAELKCKLGDYDEAMQAIDQALQIRKELMQNDTYYHSLGTKHAILQIMRKQPGCDAEKLDQKILETQWEATRAMRYRVGEPPNPDAIRVEQNEIGISDDQPIGTDNVCDCLCVMIRDPVTCKTALAHVDFRSDIASLEQILDRMPQDRQLEARLVGARFAPWDALTSQHGASASQSNLQRVKDLLEGRDINVLSADINDMRQPFTLVVDPKTFELREEVPAQHNPDEFIGNYLPWFETDQRPMHLAFDLTVSDRRAPHLFHQGHNQAVSAVEPDEIYEKSKDRVYWPRLAASIQPMMQVKKSYEEAVAHLVGVLDETVKRMGITLPDEDREDISFLLGYRPLHVGANANAFNQPIADFIRKDLFTLDGNGCLQINQPGLRRLELPKVPYARIEEEAKQVKQAKQATIKPPAPLAQAAAL